MVHERCACNESPCLGKHGKSGPSAMALRRTVPFNVYVTSKSFAAHQDCDRQFCRGNKRTRLLKRSTDPTTLAFTPLWQN